MPETAPTRLEIAAITNVGLVRSRNEDCIAVGGWVQSESMPSARAWEEKLGRPVACLVVDGMGGHVGGDVAARIAAEHLAAELASCGDFETGACVRSANRRLYDGMVSHPECRGMGATVAGLRMAPGGISVFNVGDSRVFRLQDGCLRQLSIDDVRDPFPIRASDAARSNIVTQSLGGCAEFLDVEPHVSLHRLAADATFLICSDGLYDQLSIEALESAFEPDLLASASRLFERAMRAGARDNVSLILVRVRP